MKLIERGFGRVPGRLLGLGVLAGLVATPASAFVILELGTLRNGAMPPRAQPLLRATFVTTGVGEVTLTLENLMGSNQFVDDWVFNSEKAITSSAWVSGVKASLLYPQYQSNSRNGGNEMKAGLFDVEFEFPPPKSADGNVKFLGGMTSVYKLFGTGLTENDFISYSIHDGNSATVAGWLSAAHIGGFSTPQGNSGSIVTKDFGNTPQSVPEPFTMGLLGAGAMAAYRKRRRRIAA